MAAHAAREMSPADLHSLLDEGGPGFCVIDGFLGREAALEIHDEISRLDANEILKPAGMGRGIGRWVDPTVRGDRLLWVPGGLACDPSTSPAPLAKLFAALQSLRAQLFVLAPELGLAERSSVQIACYPGCPESPRGYRRHRDAWPARMRGKKSSSKIIDGETSNASAQEVSEDVRALTCLYYTNATWTEAAGGQLRLFLDHCPARCRANNVMPEGKGHHYDIAPIIDRLVLFRSALVEHAVLPARFLRCAVTAWLYAKPPLAAKSKRSAVVEGREAVLPGGVLPAPHASLLTSESSGTITCNTSREHLSERIPSAVSKDLSLPSCADRIFVSVVAYRDPELRRTLNDLFRRADRPERISVGVCTQVDRVADARFIDTPLLSRPDQVREARMDFRDARGPCWARHLVQSMWSGEAWHLQIDSHTRFADGWDTMLIGWVQDCERVHGSHKAVLTAYPPDFPCEPERVPQTCTGSESVPDNQTVLATERTRDRGHYASKAASVASDPRPVGVATLLCATHFDPDGMLRCRGRRLRHRPPKPLLSLFWAAGFSFSRAEIIQEAPYLGSEWQCLFFGEEAAVAARLWTRGWDFFAPPASVVFHRWSRSGRASWRELFDPDGGETTLSDDSPEVQSTRDAALWRARATRMCRLQRQALAHVAAGLRGALPGWLGAERTLAAFCEFTGVDFGTRTVSATAKRGGVLDVHAKPFLEAWENRSGDAVATRALVRVKGTLLPDGENVGPSKEEEVLRLLQISGFVRK
jgi:[Skp1-protein]-hydroxyproline N-acetylglucosaminyltransferase